MEIVEILQAESWCSPQGYMTKIELRFTRGMLLLAKGNNLHILNHVLYFMISLNFDFMQNLLVYGSLDFVEKLVVGENIW